MRRCCPGSRIGKGLLPAEPDKFGVGPPAAPRTGTIGVRILDTVLGLSMTPTTVGWILSDGHGADRTVLTGAEFAVQPCAAGVTAGNASEQATATVQHVQTLVEAQGERLRGVGVTWSDDATVEAALLLESLAVAGIDNVVPVRFDQAAGPSSDGVAEAEPPLTLARGAALALEPSREFSEAAADTHPADPSATEHTTYRPRSCALSYTGALTMLVAGSVGFVVSLSIALSLQLGPAKDGRPTHQVAKASATESAVQTVTPAAVRVAPPPADAPAIPAEAPAANGEDVAGAEGQ